MKVATGMLHKLFSFTTALIHDWKMYGSVFVAARTAVDQIIDIRTTLRYLGVPIRDKSYMFGDNRSVVTSSTIPNSTISKRHHLASCHRVREAIAAKYISFHWKDGKSNPADILSKHWEFTTVWPMLKPILFWRGETATQLKGSDRKSVNQSRCRST